MSATNLQVRGWLWWRKVALPGVFPFYVTGAITASGGSWNAAIVAEVASWGDAAVAAHGLGAYIAEATAAGDFHRIVLGIAVMASSSWCSTACSGGRFTPMPSASFRLA